MQKVRERGSKMKKWFKENIDIVWLISMASFAFVVMTYVAMYQSAYERRVNVCLVFDMTYYSNWLTFSCKDENGILYPLERMEERIVFMDVAKDKTIMEALRTIQEGRE